MARRSAEASAALKNEIFSLFHQHGKKWPTEVLADVRDRSGLTRNSFGVRKSELWKKWQELASEAEAAAAPFEPPEPEPVVVEEISDWESSISAQHRKVLEKAAISADRIAKVRTSRTRSSSPLAFADGALA